MRLSAKQQALRSRGCKTAWVPRREKNNQVSGAISARDHRQEETANDSGAIIRQMPRILRWRRRGQRYDIDILHHPRRIGPFQSALHSPPGIMWWCRLRPGHPPRWKQNARQFRPYIAPHAGDFRRVVHAIDNHALGGPNPATDASSLADTSCPIAVITARFFAARCTRRPKTHCRSQQSPRGGRSAGATHAPQFVCTHEFGWACHRALSDRVQCHPSKRRHRKQARQAQDCDIFAGPDIDVLRSEKVLRGIQGRRRNRRHAGTRDGTGPTCPTHHVFAISSARCVEK